MYLEKINYKMKTSTKITGHQMIYQDNYKKRLQNRLFASQTQLVGEILQKKKKH